MPTFYYGGEPYTRIGVVSNGYVVIGGGTAADIVFAADFPNAARPNNVIAPLWTDLNPPAGGGRSGSATLTGGASTGWIVVDWDDVKNFSNATTHSFEIWIRLVQRGANRARERGGHDLVRPEHDLPG